MADRDPRHFLPLTAPAFHVLLALADADRHGYAIILEVQTRTRGDVRLRTGTLYTILRRLLDDGLIAEAATRPAREEDDERRRYYTCTALGRAVMEAEALRLSRLVELACEKHVLPRIKPAFSPGADQ